MKAKSEREVTQLCPTPSDPMDCSPPGSSIHGICQARILEWFEDPTGMEKKHMSVGVWMEGNGHNSLLRAEKEVEVCT